MKRVARLLGLGLLLSVGTAQAATWKLDKSHTTVGFSVGHLITSGQGRFDVFSSSIRFRFRFRIRFGFGFGFDFDSDSDSDSAKPEAAEVSALINSASINFWFVLLLLINDGLGLVGIGDVIQRQRECAQISEIGRVGMMTF